MNYSEDFKKQLKNENIEPIKFRKCENCKKDNILIERTTKWRKICKKCYFLSKNPIRGKCYLLNKVKNKILEKS